MSEVKWIKITTDMFEDDKIDFIQTLPEADAIIVIWVRLLTLAGKCNAGGYIYLTENIPYDPNMLAYKFRKPINTINLAIETFRKLGMIEANENGIFIANWEKHQNIDALEKIKEQGRLRQANFREKKKQNLLQEPCKSNVTVTKNVTQCNAIDKDKDKDIDIDKDIDKDKDKDIEIDNPSSTPSVDKLIVPYEDILNSFHDICKSMPKVMKLTNPRKTAIKSRYSEFNDDDIFTKVFVKVNGSDFLSGRSGDWNGCSFDWILKPNNFLKILEGNYDNKGHGKKTSVGNFNNFEHRNYDFEDLEKKLLEHDQGVS